MYLSVPQCTSVYLRQEEEAKPGPSLALSAGGCPENAPPLGCPANAKFPQNAYQMSLQQLAALCKEPQVDFYEAAQYPYKITTGTWIPRGSTKVVYAVRAGVALVDVRDTQCVVEMTLEEGEPSVHTAGRGDIPRGNRVGMTLVLVGGG